VRLLPPDGLNDWNDVRRVQSAGHDAQRAAADDDLKTKITSLAC
jgi:hypothetical protein